MTIEELIAKLESATGPDRDLDFEIAYAIDWRVSDDLNFRQYADTYKKLARKDNYPAYTESIDCALTLVPEGWTVANIGQRDSGAWWAELRRGSQTSYDKVELSGIGINDKLPLAIAICIASLKARLALTAKEVA